MQFDVIYYLNELWKILKAIWAVVVAIGGFLSAVFACLWAFVDIEGGLLAMADSIDSMTTIVQGLPTHAILDFVNRAFPLQEFLGLLAVYYGYCVVCIGIRWIRSFIPTMGG